MEFAEYFNTIQNLYADDNMKQIEKLKKESGAKLVTYEELESSLATVVQVTTIAIEQIKQFQEAKLEYVLQKLKENGTISDNIEKDILNEFSNINNIMEEETNE
mgnify:CR=1 FL=1